MAKIKIIFNEPKEYNGKHLFDANTVYEVDEELGWAARWLKRGGKEVKDEIKPLTQAQIKANEKKEKEAAQAKEAQDKIDAKAKEDADFEALVAAEEAEKVRLSNLPASGDNVDTTIP